LIIAFFCHAYAVDWADGPEFTQWESSTFPSSPVKNNEQLYSSYLLGARLLESHDSSEARSYYQKAWDTSFSGDKSEAIIKLVYYSMNDREKLKVTTEAARSWFTKNPSYSNKAVEKWLVLMESRVRGETLTGDALFQTWSVDARVEELMKSGKAKEAFNLIRSDDLSGADINKKIRHDLLSTLSLDVPERNPLHCQDLLEKNPKSFSWAMRLCKYLLHVRTGKPTAESPATIKKQFNIEDPDRLYWIVLVEKL
jgi:hypothetical protein